MEKGDKVIFDYNAHLQAGVITQVFETKVHIKATICKGWDEEYSVEKEKIVGKLITY